VLLLLWWCGRLVGNARLGEGVWAKNAKPSCRSLVSGTPCETAVGDDVEGWWDGVVVVVVVVVWPSGWKREARGGVWVKNAKPSCRSSVSGAPCETAAGDDGEGWWGGVDKVTVAAGSHVGLRKPGL